MIGNIVPHQTIDMDNDKTFFLEYIKNFSQKQIFLRSICTIIKNENEKLSYTKSRYEFLTTEHRLARLHWYIAAIYFFSVSTRDDSRTINSVSKITRSLGNNVGDSILAINISAALLPTSCCGALMVVSGMG